MKTDLELLTLAAKAAGIDAEVYSEFGLGPEGLWLKGSRTADNSSYWNPLHDDGDAFRLAVKLGIDVSHKTFGNVIADHYTRPERKKIVLHHGADPYAATRCAIVSMAAMMSQAMP